MRDRFCSLYLASTNMSQIFVLLFLSDLTTSLVLQRVGIFARAGIVLAVGDFRAGAIHAIQNSISVVDFYSVLSGNIGNVVPVA
jgi:hypothetical protein